MMMAMHFCGINNRCNKNVDIKLSAHDAFLVTFIRYAQNRKIGKPNILKVFGSNKTKGPNRIAKIG